MSYNTLKKVPTIIPTFNILCVTLRVPIMQLMFVSVCVCVYVRRPAAGPTQPITLKFGMGSSFHPGSAPSQGATPNVDPRGYPV